MAVAINQCGNCWFRSIEEVSFTGFRECKHPGTPEFVRGQILAFRDERNALHAFTPDTGYCKYYRPNLPIEDPAIGNVYTGPYKGVADALLEDVYRLRREDRNDHFSVIVLTVLAFLLTRHIDKVPYLPANDGRAYELYKDDSASVFGERSAVSFITPWFLNWMRRK